MSAVAAYLLGAATPAVLYVLRPAYRWLFRVRFLPHRCAACTWPILGAQWRQPTVHHRGHPLLLSFRIHLLYCAGARELARAYAEQKEKAPLHGRHER